MRAMSSVMKRRVSARPRPNGKRGSSRGVEEEAQIARIAHGAVDAVGYERMAGLDGDAAAEAIAQREDLPETERAARGEEEDARPAPALATDDEKPARSLHAGT
jgi:hypothetical protein